MRAPLMTLAMSAALQGTRPVVLATSATYLASRAFQWKQGDRFAQYMAAADLLGRLHVLIDAKRKTGKVLPLNSRTRLALHFDDSVLGFESVPFDAAIERIRNLTPMTKVAFDALRGQYRMQAFAVAGLSDVRMIEKIQAALLAVIESGGTQDDFRKAVDAITSEAGVASLEDAHISTIFQTSFQTAYSNGRFEQMRDPAVVQALPYWKYWTVGDNRVRPAHAALDGFCANWNDPVWRRIYPPTGYNCRCSVTAVGPEDASPDAELPGLPRIPEAAADVPDPGFGGVQ